MKFFYRHHWPSVRASRKPRQLWTQDCIIIKNIPTNMHLSNYFDCSLCWYNSLPAICLHYCTGLVTIHACSLKIEQFVTYKLFLFLCVSVFSFFFASKDRSFIIHKVSHHKSRKKKRNKNKQLKNHTLNFSAMKKKYLLNPNLHQLTFIDRRILRIINTQRFFNIWIWEVIYSNGESWI